MRMPPKHSARRAGKAMETEAATRDALVAANEYRTVPVTVKTRDGPRVWRVHARVLSWEEQSAITDKHTKVYQADRGTSERRVVDQTAIVRELLERMIDGPKCDPPLSKEDLRALRIEALTAFADAFGLTEDHRRAEVKLAGESEAP